MKVSRIALTTMALALMIVSFAAGRLTTLAQVTGAAGAASPTVSPTQPIIDFPPEEVAGEDVPDLPRYPGATRVEFRRTMHADVTVTESEYVVDAEIDAIRDFFRNFLRGNGWTITDLDFSAGEWTIVAVAREREVVFEIESRGPLAEYEVRLTEPSATRIEHANTTATVEPPGAPEATTTSVPAPPAATALPAVAPPTATALLPADRPLPTAPAPSPSSDNGTDDQDDGTDGGDGVDDQDNGTDGDDG